MINNDYPLNTLNQLRPLLIGFRKANGLTQKDLSERLGSLNRHTHVWKPTLPVRALNGYSRCFPSWV
jgi:HTH-type transcriptional regulator/antitoxin HipB